MARTDTARNTAILERHYLTLTPTAAGNGKPRRPRLARQADACTACRQHGKGGQRGEDRGCQLDVAAQWQPYTTGLVADAPDALGVPRRECRRDEWGWIWPMAQGLRMFASSGTSMGTDTNELASGPGGPGRRCGAPARSPSRSRHAGWPGGSPARDVGATADTRGTKAAPTCTEQARAAR